MNHRHLLPDEIDLLLDDDEVGFGVAPLKAHIRDCADCRARVDEARFVVEALEDIPHFAPSHRFADRVLDVGRQLVVDRASVAQLLRQGEQCRAGRLGGLRFGRRR